MSLKKLSGNRRNPSLLFRDEVEEEPESRGNTLLVIGLFTVVFTLLSMITIGAVTYTVFIDKPTTTTTIPTTTTTTTTTSTSTTTTTTTTSTTTTTTTTSTTTTTLCGGGFQQVCEDGNCSDGFAVGSLGLCQPIECSPSTPSGKDGCGEWAFKFCR